VTDQGTLGGATSSQEISALNATLGDEYAATYAYGLIGAQLTGNQQKRALAALNSHRSHRDVLRADLAAAQATVVPPAAVYDTGVPINSAATAVSLAIEVERRLIPRWAEVASTRSGPGRIDAAKNGQECAVRAVTWGGQPQAFPG
jgi:hypothetical protein